jgi:hypothetical protein
MIEDSIMDVGRMKLKEGEPMLADFNLGDIETPIKKIVQDFVKVVLEQEKPQLRLVYPHTTGDAMVDAQYCEGFRPEDPLTLRLYLNAFVPDDGSSIQYDISLADLINNSLRRYPTVETMQAVHDALEKQLAVIKDYMENYKPEPDDDE